MILSTPTRGQDCLEKQFNVLFIGVRTPSVDPDCPNLRVRTVLHKISFQYYPLDLDATSNPFVVSWWPLALGDPALFHVSLQTACLDEDLLARSDFRNSDILMLDSVALIRRKVEDISLAVQDATMNSVITLATIEVSPHSTLIVFLVCAMC